MVDKLLPAFRQLVSRRLGSQGFSQSRISSMLNITQASVSHYLSGSPAAAYATLTELSLGREEADRYTALLAEDAKRNPVDSVETLVSLWTNLLASGRVCPAHRKLSPSLAQCDVCFRLHSRAERQGSQVIEEVARAVRMVEDSPSFVRVMPEISVNIAYVEADSDSPDDVVAVPGRIVRVKNSARSLSAPEFGASRHVAKVLLLVRRKISEHRAAINLIYDGRMAAVLERLNVHAIQISGSYPSRSDDPTLEALRERLVQPTGRFDAVIDTGGKGIEPSLYLFGRSPIDVATQAISIAEAYSAS